MSEMESWAKIVNDAFTEIKHNTKPEYRKRTNELVQIILNEFISSLDRIQSIK